MNKPFKYSVATLAGLALPALVFAQQMTLKTLMGVVADYLNTALQLLMGLAVLFFVWYVIQYFIKSSESKGRGEAGQYVLWSLIGFFVILSFWGLVNILTNTFQLNNNAPTAGQINSLFPH